MSELFENLMQASVWVFAFIALVSLVSVLVKRPWTAIIARRDNPPEVVASDLFLETNMVISAVWSLLFAVAALLSAVAPFWLGLAYGLLLFYLGHVSPRFGAWYATKRLRALGLEDHVALDSTND